MSTSMSINLNQLKQTQQDTESIDRILKYWFGTSFPPPEDSPFRSYWFRATPEQDKEMKATFSPLWTEAVANEELRTRWSTTRAGSMALIILLDQLPRNMFRGTPQMFSSDALILPLALEMTDSANNDTTPVEKVFIYTAIQHTEDWKYAIMAETGLTELVKSLANKKYQRKYMKLLPSAKAHCKVLKRFGRYCQRNLILNRPSTEEEKEFLLAANNNFIRSVGGPKLAKSQIAKNSIHESSTPIRPMRVLLLHGFRQNATTIKVALKPLMTALRPYPIEFITLNSPMVYQPGTTPFGDSDVDHPTWALPNKHLRCWWNASDDGKEYHGWENSVRFVERAWIENGGWDGIVAFSQGATLVSLLSSMPQLSCSKTRFAVLISGSPSRATVHQEQFRNPIQGVKTLSIYGRQDQHLGPPEEMKERTLKLAGFYEGAEILEHKGGHFTSKWWPWAEITKFIVAQALPVENFSGGDRILTEQISVEARLGKMVERSKLPRIHQRMFPPVYDVSLAKAFDCATSDLDDCDRSILDAFVAASDEITRTDASTGEQYLDDLFVIAFSYHSKYNPRQQDDIFRELLSQLGIHAPEYLIKRFPYVVKFGHWRDLNNLIADNWTYITSRTVFTDPAKLIHNAILEFMGNQLKQDAALIGTQSGGLSGEEGEGQDFTSISILAQHVPRINSSVDNLTHFARDLALWLRPARNDNEKLTSYIGYQKLYRSICTILENTDPNRDNYGKGKEAELMLRLTLEQRKRILAMPPNVFVKVPEEVPVAACPLEDLEPVIKHLKANAPIPNENVKFVRGTIVPVKTPAGSKGVLDMCKMVVGPEGITPLLDGLKLSKGVEGLLLGNNVTGSKGAREIAKYIRREDSQITTWYLGGNQFGPQDIGVIFQPLETDSKVHAVWLKRNPILPEGTMHIAKTLSINRTLITLDLSNCGLLDEGCIRLFQIGMKDNRTLKHLYLNTNGISSNGVRFVAEYFDNGGTLESLYMSCNPLGDEGIEMLANSLKGKKELLRLGLASCAIGQMGIDALVKAFATLPKLEYLNLGFLKGTYLFNGLPNYLGLYGIQLLCSVFPQMPGLRYLDICHNQIPVEGLAILQKTLTQLPEGTGLTTLLFGQFGQQRSEFIEQQLNASLLTNKLMWGKKMIGGEDEGEWLRVGEEMSQRALCPDHVKEIMSTTRNMD